MSVTSLTERNTDQKVVVGGKDTESEWRDEINRVCVENTEEPLGKNGRPTILDFFYLFTLYQGYVLVWS